MQRYEVIPTINAEIADHCGYGCDVPAMHMTHDIHDVLAIYDLLGIGGIGN